MTEREHAQVGFIGGVGQRLALEDEREVDVRTPYGPTSVPVRIGRLGGKEVAALSRRGVDEVLQPHLVPYRANVWALASLGIDALITTTAAGGLRDSFAPGLFVVADQVIDRTHGRHSTFYDEGAAVQLAAPDPFDPTLRGLAVEALAGQGVRHRDFGTVVVIDGPRFATRAESRWHAAMGGDLVTTTSMPETTLALELDVPVVGISVITDRDAGSVGEQAEITSLDLVRQRARQSTPVLQRAVTDLVRSVPAGMRRGTGVPQDAVASVLARPVR